MKINTEFVTPEKIRDELSRILPLLPSWRREKALSFHFDKDRYLCAKSFLLLQQTVSAEFGVSDLPPFSYGTNGKPYWKEYPQIHFNISHCDTGIACAVGSEPVGIDIERIFFDKTLAEEVLSPAELNDVLSHTSPALQFMTYWTKKESFLKLTGTGIADDLKNVLLRHGEEVFFETRVYAEHDCLVTTAVWKKGAASAHC